MILHCPRCWGEITWDLVWDRGLKKFVDEFRCIKCGERYEMVGNILENRIKDNGKGIRSYT